MIFCPRLPCREAGWSVGAIYRFGFYAREEPAVGCSRVYCAGVIFAPDGVTKMCFVYILSVLHPWRSKYTCASAFPPFFYSRTELELFRHGHSTDSTRKNEREKKTAEYKVQNAILCINSKSQLLA